MSKISDQKLSKLYLALKLENFFNTPLVPKNEKKKVQSQNTLNPEQTERILPQSFWKPRAYQTTHRSKLNAITE